MPALGTDPESLLDDADLPSDLDGVVAAVDTAYGRGHLASHAAARQLVRLAQLEILNPLPRHLFEGLAELPRRLGCIDPVHRVRRREGVLPAELGPLLVGHPAVVSGVALAAKRSAISSWGILGIVAVIGDSDAVADKGFVSPNEATGLNAE